jgi:histidinol-phosphate/aromatic aminotransferase/cobyric acid decarboxylase-like protein
MNSIYYYSLFTVFGIVAFMIVVDKNVGEYLLLSIKMLKINIERLKWMAIYHPNNPITTWWMNRKLKKFIKEMQARSETVQSE